MIETENNPLEVKIKMFIIVMGVSGCGKYDLLVILLPS